MYSISKFAVGLFAVSASDVYDSGNALSLLQTSSVKHSELSFSKECKAAKAAHRAAKAKVKTDKSAIKAARKALKDARAALKAARATKVESVKAVDAAYDAMLEVCPVKEVDLTSPDEGCSATIVTSYRPEQGVQPQGPDLLNPAVANAANGLRNNLDGFKEVLPGGGVPEGDGKAYGDKLGIAIMQPCSVAWTAGDYVSPKGTIWDGSSDGKIPGTGEVVFRYKHGFRNHCACLEWAKSVAPWPESVAVTFQSNGGNPAAYGASICKVHKQTGRTWKDMGLALTLGRSYNDAFTCYLGNPAEWQKFYKSEKAENHLIDKCSKPQWSRWKLKPAEKLTGAYTPTPFKSLWTGSGLNGKTVSTADCYKAAKAEPACAKAVALSWFETHGWCKCIFQTPWLEGNQPPGNQDRDRVNNYVCLM